MDWLCTEVLPHLPARFLETHPLRVVGNDLSLELMARWARCPAATRWIGWVPDVAPYVRSAEAMIAPLRSGAGTKGKVIQSLVFGTPVVTTSIGAEGLGLVPGRHALIANEPRSFANAMVRLTENAQLWRELSTTGSRHAAACFGPAVAGRALDAVLAALDRA
jgi:glycosyltransferase involved in cell wall biosynthesis